MKNGVSLKRKIQHILTAFILRLQGAKIKETTECEYNGYINEVYIYTSNSKNNAQAYPWGTIVFPEFIFTNYSKVVQNYFFLHELGHLKLNLLIKLFVYVLFSVSMFLSLSGGMFLLILIITTLIKVFPVSNFAFGFTYYSRYVIFFGLLGILTFWLHELNADMFAISSLGKESFVEARNEMRVKSVNPRLTEKIIQRILYPPSSLLWYIFNRTAT
jgi:hypothetical protein